MRCLQFLPYQGIAFRGNEDSNNNLTQLLMLISKNYPVVIQKLKSKGKGKLYTHHDYQNELFQIMANQVLQKKIMELTVTFIPSCVMSTKIFQIKNNIHSVFIG